MALIYPSADLEGAHESEREVALTLKASLPDCYHIFCNLDWARPSDTLGKKTGEIDFIIAAPSNHLHVIELSLGRLELDGVGNFVLSTYDGARNKSKQLNSNKKFIFDLLSLARKRNLDIPQQKIEGWLLIPNSKINRAIPILRYPEDHIIDRSSDPDPILELTRKIRKLSGEEGNENRTVTRGIIQLFSQAFEYVPDTSSLAESEIAFTTKMQDTANIILSVESSGRMIVVDGVAGSGKTQLGLIGLNYFRRQSLKCCLVANTRVLPNLLRRELGSGADVFPYNDFIKSNHKHFDRIFIDEAHHFNENAVKLIESKLSEHGKLYVLMDNAQNFDERFVPTPDAITFHLNTSYRVPAKLCEFLSELKPLRRTLKSAAASIDTQFDLHIGDCRLTSCIDHMEKFFQDKASLVKHSGIVFCGSKFELNQQLQECANRLVSFYRNIGIEITVDQILNQLAAGGFDVDATDNKLGLAIDTIRRWQGTSKAIIFVCNLKKQSTVEIACRIFYSATTRSRARCEIFGTKEFAQQLIEATI